MGRIDEQSSLGIVGKVACSPCSKGDASSRSKAREPVYRRRAFALHPVTRVTRLAHRNGDGRFRFNLIFRRGHLYAVVRALLSRCELYAHRTDFPGVLNPRRGARCLGEDVCPQAKLRTRDRPGERDSSLSDGFHGVVRVPSSWPKARFSRDAEGNSVKRPQAPTSAKDESIVVHRPGFVPSQRTIGNLPSGPCPACSRTWCKEWRVRAANLILGPNRGLMRRTPALNRVQCRRSTRRTHANSHLREDLD